MVCFQALKELDKWGGLILGVSNVVRKLQTEKEKVLPFPENYKEEANDNVCVDLLTEKTFKYKIATHLRIWTLLVRWNRFGPKCRR